MSTRVAAPLRYRVAVGTTIPSGRATSHHAGVRGPHVGSRRVTSGHVGRDGRGRVHAIDYSIVNHRKRRSINTPRPCGISWAALNESNQLSATRLIL